MRVKEKQRKKHTIPLSLAVLAESRTHGKGLGDRHTFHGLFCTLCLKSYIRLNLHKAEIKDLFP